MRLGPRARAPPRTHHRPRHCEAFGGLAQHPATDGREMLGHAAAHILRIILTHREVTDLADEAGKPDFEDRPPVGRLGPRLAGFA